MEDDHFNSTPSAEHGASSPVIVAQGSNEELSEGEPIEESALLEGSLLKNIDFKAFIKVLTRILGPGVLYFDGNRQLRSEHASWRQIAEAILMLGDLESIIKSAKDELRSLVIFRRHNQV